MAQIMYALKPVFDLDAKVEVPTCMYSLPVIQSSTPIEGIGMSKVKLYLRLKCLNIVIFFSQHVHFPWKLSKLDKMQSWLDLVN